MYRFFLWMLKIHFAFCKKIGALPFYWDEPNGKLSQHTSRLRITYFQILNIISLLQTMLHTVVFVFREMSITHRFIAAAQLSLDYYHFLVLWNIKIEMDTIQVVNTFLRFEEHLESGRFWICYIDRDR